MGRQAVFGVLPTLVAVHSALIVLTLPCPQVQDVRLVGESWARKCTSQCRHAICLSCNVCSTSPPRSCMVKNWQTLKPDFSNCIVSCNQVRSNLTFKPGCWLWHEQQQAQQMAAHATSVRCPGNS